MKFFKNNIFVKFLTILCIAIFLPMTVVSIVGYHQSSRQMEYQTTELLFQIATDISNQIDKTIKDYVNIINQLIISKYFISFLELQANDYYNLFQFSSWMDDNISQTFFVYKPYICGIMIKNNYGATYYYNRLKEDTFSGEKGMQKFSILENQLASDGKIQLFAFPSFADGNKNLQVDPFVVIMGRRIYSLKTLKPGGAFFLLFYTAELNQIWDNVNLRGALVTIADEKNQIIYHSNKHHIGKSLSDVYNDEAIQMKTGIYRSNEDIDYYLVTHTSESTGWNTIVTIPVKQLMSPIDNIRNTIMLAAIIAFIITITLGYIFIFSILNPLRKLRVVMSKTGDGKWYSYQEKIPNDEIGYLITNYNNMVNRMSELINEVYLTELDKKKEELARQKAEFQAMQAQINPHFLYNTLDAVNSYTLLNKKDSVSSIVDSLADMFRYAVKSPLELVKLKDEQNNVSNYLTIQKYRLGAIPEIIWEIDAYRENQILRLTLQPIIENCFKHAFIDGIEPYHKIRISANSINDEFYLTVEDNGIGTSFEINNFKFDSDQQGIGLPNVSKRIQLIFGTDYGLTISSKPGCGTIVSIKIPLLE
jgi:two-component system sensor histidine kinase YesM